MKKELKKLREFLQKERISADLKGGKVEDLILRIMRDYSSDGIIPSCIVLLSHLISSGSSECFSPENGVDLEFKQESETLKRKDIVRFLQLKIQKVLCTLNSLLHSLKQGPM
jgi:hypothetical protein